MVITKIKHDSGFFLLLLFLGSHFPVIAPADKLEKKHTKRFNVGTIISRTDPQFCYCSAGDLNTTWPDFLKLCMCRLCEKSEILHKQMQTEAGAGGASHCDTPISIADLLQSLLNDSHQNILP